MGTQYQTLMTIYSLVKDDPQPLTCLLNQRQIIVRQMLGWDVIQEHLQLLSEEGLISIKQLDTWAISITQEGINKIKKEKIKQIEEA